MAKQRQVRVEQGLPQSLMEDMQDRTDEQLESESKHRSIALAILGARAAERYDAATARTYFQRAIAASRPQERMQIRRMADASLALAERRADDLKHAVEKLGQAPPSGRALMGLRLMGLIVPPPGSSMVLRIRGFAILAALVIGILALGLGVVELISLPFGGIGLAPGILLGLFVVGIALAVLAYVGRRKQRAAKIGGRGAGGGAKGAVGAKGSAKGATPAKGSTAAKGSAATRGNGSSRGAAPTRGAAASKPAKGAAAAKGASQAKAKGAAPGRGAAAANGKPATGGSSQTRRGGGSARATAGAKETAPAKPAKGRPSAKGAKGPARPKRPSR
jgi:hypothetical protein